MFEIRNSFTMDIVFSHIQKFNESNQRAVLCIVVDTSGSSPRKAGAKMLVLPDGNIVGTVGGGSVERRCREIALRLLYKGDACLHSFDLSDDLSMHCGGTMDVYFEPIGSINRLIIFGAGHVGKALANLASGFGFHISIVDPRPGIFDDFPAGIVSFPSNYVEAIPTLEINEHCFVVVLTPQHIQDEEVTAKAATLKPAYIGMIGSKAKVAKAKIRFAEEFHLPSEIIQSIDMPIGIPLKVETPAEIALSIVARLVDIRNRLAAGENI
jgi:xanthine dehydrogenase accessory factor